MKPDYKDLVEAFSIALESDPERAASCLEPIFQRLHALEAILGALNGVDIEKLAASFLTGYEVNGWYTFPTSALPSIIAALKTTTLSIVDQVGAEQTEV